jgi:hypothetical protein
MFGIAVNIILIIIVSLPMIELFDKFFHYREQDFMRLVEGRDFSSVKELKQYLVPALSILLKVPMDRIQQDYLLSPPGIGVQRRCMVAMLNKKKTNAMLIFELKLEDKMGKRRPIEEDIKSCKTRLFKLMQIGSVSNGILLTDKRCIFFSCDYDEKRRIENPHSKDKLVRRTLLSLR